MSDVIATPEGAPINIDPSAVKQAPATATAPAAASPNDKPEWLDARLAQARNAALKDAGFESIEDAKKAAKELSDKREAEKSDAQKRGELAKTLEQKDKQLNEMADALKAYAVGQMAALSDAQKAAVAAVAGDDPAKQLKTIEALKPTWASAAAPAATAKTETKIADSAPGRTMPKEGPSGSGPDHNAVWAELQKSNPILAARYASENGLIY
jgi:hypothetical protein